MVATMSRLAEDPEFTSTKSREPKKDCMRAFELLAVGAEREPEVQGGAGEVDHFALVIDAAGIVDAASPGSKGFGRWATA